MSQIRIVLEQNRQHLKKMLDLIDAQEKLLDENPEVEDVVNKAFLQNEIDEMTNADDGDFWKNVPKDLKEMPSEVKLKWYQKIFRKRKKDD